MPVRVKICGITNLNDALAAIDAGADALGFIFFPGSPRYISPENAAAITAQIPPLVAKIGVFVDEASGTIARTKAEVDLNAVQQHGTESPESCAALGGTVIKAFRVKDH